MLENFMLTVSDYVYMANNFTTGQFMLMAISFKLSRLIHLYWTKYFVTDLYFFSPFYTYLFFMETLDTV